MSSLLIKTIPNLIHFLNFTQYSVCRIVLFLLIFVPSLTLPDSKGVIIKIYSAVLTVFLDRWLRQTRQNITPTFQAGKLLNNLCATALNTLLFYVSCLVLDSIAPVLSLLLSFPLTVLYFQFLLLPYHGIRLYDLFCPLDIIWPFLLRFSKFWFFVGLYL